MLSLVFLVSDPRVCRGSSFGSVPPHHNQLFNRAATPPSDCSRRHGLNCDLNHRNRRAGSGVTHNKIREWGKEQEHETTTEQGLPTLSYLPYDLDYPTCIRNMTETQQQQLQLSFMETDEEPETIHVNNNTRHRPPRPSALPRKSLLKPMGGRSRRRSSARFLSIGGGRRGGNDNDVESLGKMYKHAIKMNAENRINASNSWNFKLIENIDKFLMEDSNEERRANVPNTPSQVLPPRPDERRVNFTKASCTLDASVKIYSYRVDDVHLTSYRVLENLHRSDNDKKKKKGTTDDEAPERATQHRSRAAVSTVEANVCT